MASLFSVRPKFAGSLRGVARLTAMFAVIASLAAPAFASGKKAKADGKELGFRITTSLGPIEGILHYKKVPQTVSNFVTLARKKFYDGIVFHRVIPKFMIQTGDPKGTGMGGPGYRFKDEFHKDLKHEVGVLSMANAGPDTNGSQFFITVVATHYLDGRHAVFGKVTKGFDIAKKISEVERDSRDRPKKEIKMEKVEILGDWYTPEKVIKIEN